MWGLPGSGNVSSALAGEFLPLSHQGSPKLLDFFKKIKKIFFGSQNTVNETKLVVTRDFLTAILYDRRQLIQLRNQGEKKKRSQGEKYEPRIL